MAVTVITTNSASLAMARSLSLMSQAIGAGTERYTDSRSHAHGYCITFETTRRDSAIEALAFEREGPYFGADCDDRETCLVSLRFSRNCSPLIRESLWQLVRRHCRALAEIEFASKQIRSDNMREIEERVGWIETEIEDMNNLQDQIYFAWSAR